VEFAIYFGEKTLIYKRQQGIVLNEPTLTAKTNGKLVAVGKDAIRHIDHGSVAFESPLYRVKIRDISGAAAFLKSMSKKVGGIIECIFLIPSSVDAEGLQDYKTVIYTAGINEAVFVPATVASAISFGHDIRHTVDPIISIVREDEIADINVIKKGEIIDGGTVKDLSKMDTVIAEYNAKYNNPRVYNGNHISAINGAGKLLLDRELVKKIVKLN
jgi:actin-like ATPase involved in cell morphogenesis